ncbi:MAG: hypothetical protein DI603_17825 [Roseateles depolymerans]|uniref:Uncharacterized protein n=1 Tax=Roseateles depolymerans TaxID=76731 RepID=A0A2W5DH24_9BURK|nr:MAG: hypothetical protein DI603_17825 [Roseateles depolymerans]
MDMRHPVQSLTWALMRALEQDLAGSESALVNELLRTEAGPITVRPRVEDCTVVLFSQVWRAGDLGWVRGDEEERIEAETVVITGPAGDACVYVSTQLMYHVGHPNRRFFLDVAGQCMRARTQSSAYEGRDSADLEALDFEVAGALARISGALHGMDQPDAARVARALRDCVSQVEATAGLQQGLPVTAVQAVSG